ncbi:MAG: ferredoxin [Deltaproteobacteria bacterium HGW-Deltaproteobacteria-14]|nr:MAG: ferredoxin [Deltaproteobacteria bacterium HGW-Deltaproteobacteria-14]
MVAHTAPAPHALAAHISVDGRPVTARAGEPLLDALRREGIHVPTLCHLAHLTPTGACRLCVVEVEGQRNLVPSCAFPVADGMVVLTHSQRAQRARKTIVELLLADHPDDCLYCVRAGNCDLATLAAELGVRERRYRGGGSERHVDASSPALLRDPAKCILCGRCVRVCEEVQGVGAIDFIGRGCHTEVGTAFQQGLNLSTCISCGQCINVCPTGALREVSHLKPVTDALGDPRRVAVVQHAPSISVTLAETLGLAPEVDAAGVLNAVLRRLGFTYVFDTSFAADLTIMEEASELVQRITSGGALPMMTSCSPGWVAWVEQEAPDFIPNLSSCKSPQQMLGAVIKRVWAERHGRLPDEVFSVAIMPCTAKKAEAARPEMAPDGVPDVDAVLTTRELLRLIKLRGLDVTRIAPEPADSPFGERSGAGKLFGVTGGVAEAALRTAYAFITGSELPAAEITELRGLDEVKELHVKIGELSLGVAVVNGLKNARPLLEAVRAGRRPDLTFIEVMTCPGGCIAGGGQPLGADLDAVRARMRALYAIDAGAELRRSHDNPQVRALYDEVLGAPLGAMSHRLLHTAYAPR